LRFAVLGFDLAQHVAQRRAVGGVARQHLIGDRKTFRRHDQRDHHLHAVAALVAAVAVAALVVLIVRWRCFEIGAGQIVQQDFEAYPKQILPALAQMIEQRRLVFQQFVEAAIERILLHQRIIGAQKTRHRALLKPVPVQAPLAAGIDQPIAHQRLQDVPPPRPFARVQQTICPELIEAVLLIKPACQPARTPLPRSMQLHRLEPYLHAVTFGVRRNLAIGRKQRQLAMPPRAFIKGLD